MRHRGRLWPIVLAGGEGERVRPLVKAWLGYHRPKQYCSFVGTRSLFQHTVDRADRLGSAERRIAVVANEHRELLPDQLRGRSPGTVLFQPRNRGTAAGIFLPLTQVMARDPDGTVIILPSDHFIHPEEPFLQAVRHSLSEVEKSTKRLIVLGVRPTGPDGDYGWITPGTVLTKRRSGLELRAVRAFREKPMESEAKKLLGSQGLWNTLIVVGKAATLWKLGRRLTPEIMPSFQRLREAVGGAREAEVLQSIYETMPQRDFSAHLLSGATDQLAVQSLDSVMWSDWGRPERIAETLTMIGKRPAFPESCLEPRQRLQTHRPSPPVGSPA